MKRIYKLLVVIIIVLAIGFLLYGVKSYYQHKKLVAIQGQNQENQKVGEYVLQKLKGYYNEDFVIKSSRYVPQMGIYEFVCYPQKNSLMIFTTRTSGIGEGISDSYLRTEWIYDTSKYYQPYLDTICPYYSINLGAMPGDELYVKSNDNNYNFSYLYKNYRNQLAVGGKIYYFEKVTPENREAITKSLYTFYEKLYSEKYKEVDISIYFRDPALFESKEAQEFAKEEGIFDSLKNCDEFVKLYDAAYFQTGFSKYNNADIYINIDNTKFSAELTYNEFSNNLKYYENFKINN